MKRDNILQLMWKKLHIDFWLCVGLISTSAGGLWVLYNAVRGDDSMFYNRIIQLSLGVIVMLMVAQLPPAFYKKISIYVYIIGVFLLLLVIAFGTISKGAQRWLNLGIFRFQPSEIVKICVPLVVSKYLSEYVIPPTFLRILIALILTLIPTLLVILQPDLGTAILICFSGLCVIFLAGMTYKIIVPFVLSLPCILYFMWNYMMHTYQKERILTLLNPERDPLGKGYHIIQSMIAIGSGGLEGKGAFQGTQSQLEFLPEPHTDFIFAVLAEEFGFMGICLLCLGYFFIIGRLIMMALQEKDIFGKLFIGSVALMFFAYFYVNMAMTSGIFPVVGVPLPLVSYGGTFFVSLMVSFGIVMSIKTHKREVFQ